MDKKRYVVILHLDVMDGTYPHKWDWDHLLDVTDTEVTVHSVVTYNADHEDDLPNRIRCTVFS